MTVSERFSVPALILGAGAWGTALAVHWSKRAQPGQVSLWTRREEHLQELESARLNQRYLPGVPLPDALDLSPVLKPALLAFRERSQGQANTPGGLIVLACPVAGLSQLAAAVSDTLGPAELGEGLVWLSKGLVEDGDNFYWPSDLVRRAMRTDWPMAALTGPSFAMEVAKGLPCALTAASTDIDFARRLARICHGFCGKEFSGAIDDRQFAAGPKTRIDSDGCPGTCRCGHQQIMKIFGENFDRFEICFFPHFAQHCSFSARTQKSRIAVFGCRLQLRGKGRVGIPERVVAEFTGGRPLRSALTTPMRVS